MDVQQLGKWNSAVEHYKIKHSAALLAKKRADILLSDAQTLRQATYRAAEVLQAVAERAQRATYASVAEIVSRCLEAVFDDPYVFTMEFVRRRGRTEIDLLFERDGQALDPMSAAGGGVVDVASFALRLAAILLAGPGTRRFLALDEPFRFVSKEYRPRLRSLLEELSEKMGVQILLVTHMDEFRVGKILELGDK